MKKIILQDEEVDVYFHHKKTKHSYVRIKHPGEVHVTVGKNATQKLMETYITDHQETILKSIKKYKTKKPYQLFGQNVKQVYTGEQTVHYDEDHQVLYLPSKDTNKHLKKFEKQLLLRTVNDMLKVFPHQKIINIKDLSINTRYTTSVHGSCNARKKRINLNLYLVRRNKEFLHYVLMHELAHLKVQNHSKAFYKVLEILCPNYKEIKKEMKRT